MLRLRRSVALSLLAGACLAFSACDKFGTGSQSTNGSTNGSAVVPQAQVDIGGPLFPGVKLTALPEAPTLAEPIVIHPAIIQYDVKVQIPAQVDGLIELIASPVTGPVNKNDPMIVYHPRDVEKKNPYRRLRENDRVVLGQTLVRLDEQLVALQIDSGEKMIEASTRVIEAGTQALNSYLKLLKLQEDLAKTNTVSLSELENTRATVARLREGVIQSEKEKVKSEGEYKQASTQLSRYFSRSPVNGRITKLLKAPGEFAKAGEVIMEIQSTDWVRVEGKVDAQYATLIKKGVAAVIEPTVPLGPSPFSNWHRQEVAALAVSAHPGRPLVVSGGLDAAALVWDVTDSKRSHRLPHPAGCGVRAVACSPANAKTGHLLATGGDDGKVRFWNIADPNKLPTTPTDVLEDGHASGVTAAAFSPDGLYLATAAGRDVFIWDVVAKKKKYALPSDHRDAVTTVRFTPQATLVTVARDRTIRVWKLGESGAALTEPVIDHRSGTVDVLGVSTDGTRVLFDKDVGRLDVLGLADGRTLGTIVNPGNGSRFAGLALFSPTDQLILTSGGDADGKGELQLWEAPQVGGRASERRRLVTPGRAAVTCAAFSPDAAKPFMVVGTQYGGVHFWTPPGKDEVSKQWIGKVESVLPADARSVQVRVVMENVSDATSEGLQDRGTATIIINPDGSVKVPTGPLAPVPVPPAPVLPIGPKAAINGTDGGLKLVGGVADPGSVVRVGGVVGDARAILMPPIDRAPVPTPPVPDVPRTSVLPPTSPTSLPGLVVPPVPEK